MPSLSAWRSRPVAENLVLLAVAACLCIAVVRIAVVALAALETPAASATPFTKSATWKSWWGGRVTPFRDGGDYLGVLSHSTPERIVGPVIAVVVERDRARGIRIDRVLAPIDEAALFGKPAGVVFTRPNGTTFLVPWAPLGQYAAYITAVPIEQAVYDPFLDEAAYTALAARTHFTERCLDFYSATPVAGGSGTWMLFSHQAAHREYLLVPLETIQAGGAS